MTDPDKRLVQVTVTIKGGANIRVEGEDPAIMAEYLSMDEDALVAMLARRFTIQQVARAFGIPAELIATGIHPAHDGQVDNDSEAVVD